MKFVNIRIALPLIWMAESLFASAMATCTSELYVTHESVNGGEMFSRNSTH